MVVAAPQHSSGVGPQAENIPHGPPPVQGPRPPVPGSFRGPYPDRQQQQNGWPFFCVPPSQPYLPYQWPMPVPYVPYGGFPGMGMCYGMVVQPFSPASYMEPPGYILPHAQLHMADYRRMMAPHLPPTMAYQARRFRYQHTTPSGRVMVSSEVQTEPVGTESPQHDCKGATSSQTNSESGRGTASSSNFSSPKPHADTSACPEEAFGITLNKSLADTVDPTSNVSSAVPNSEIVFQAEEVRIECSGTRAGLKIIHAKETTELASSGELLQCNMGSVHSAEDVVLRCYQPLAFGDDQTEPLDDLSHADDTEMHTLAVQGDPSLVKGEDDLCASVWSVESLVPYVPSAEWMIQNGLLTPQKPSLATVMEVPSEVPLEASQPAADAASTPQENLQTERAIELDGQDSVTSLESLPPYLPAASWLADFSNVYYSKLPSNVQQVGNLGTWPEGQLGEKSEVSQDTNVKSLVSPKSGSVQFKEPRSRHRSRTAGLSPSHLDGCPVKSHSGMPHSPEHKVRMCKSCLVKQKARNVSGSPSPNSNCVKRHKAAHSHLTGDKTKLHLCAVCICDPEKSRCKASVDGETTEGEASENSLYPIAGPKKRAADGQKMLHNSQKVSSGRHSEKCPMARQSKLREQNCSCEGPKGVPSSAQIWDSSGYGQHKDLTLEKNERNMALYATERWRDTEQRSSSQKPKGRMFLSPFAYFFFLFYINWTPVV
uniref:Bucky ball n=1 Tax=Pygocentrus nattereri TaxID=42514 RepID=A0AAR2LNU8_PYGNA